MIARDAVSDVESGQAAPTPTPTSDGDAARGPSRRKKGMVALVAVLAAAVLALALGLSLGGGGGADADADASINANKAGAEIEGAGADASADVDGSEVGVDAYADVSTDAANDEIEGAGADAPADVDGSEAENGEGTIYATSESDEASNVGSNDNMGSMGFSNDFMEVFFDPEPAESGDDSAQGAQYLASNGPLAARVRKIDPTIAGGYDSCDGLREDIANAVRHNANEFIMRESRGSALYEWCDPGNPNWYQDWLAYERSYMPTSANTPTVGSELTSPPASSPASTGAGEDSFETNNQVEGVDEADVAKSDGVHVYAAYGDVLYAWNAADGTQGVSATKIPSSYDDDLVAERCEDYLSRPGWPTYSWPTFSPTSSSPPTTSKRPTYAPVTRPPTTPYPTFAPTIESPAMPFPTEDETGGCPVERRDRRDRRKAWSPYGEPCKAPERRILSLLLDGNRLAAIVEEGRPYWHRGDDEAAINDYTKLILHVYDTSIVPADGSPLRLLGKRELKGGYDAARSVGSTGYIVTTSFIQWPFQKDLYRSKDHYCGLNSTEYETLASEIAINATAPYVERLLGELQLHLDDDACGSIFQVRAFQSGDNDEDKSNGDLLNQFVMVSSFDMGLDSPQGEVSADSAPVEIVTKVAGAFSSGYVDSIYASKNLITTQNVGSSYNSASGHWDHSSFILGFDVSGTAPRPFAYAEVPGSPLNQYSIDYHNGHLRVVTTETDWSWWETDNESESRTTNKIFVLKVPDPEERGGSEMELVGESQHLGKPNEEVYAVRFIGSMAYIVTFEQIDPFLVYDLSDPTSPTKLGELEIPGFSSYLHPVDMDGVAMMLGLGEHIDPRTQCRAGVKISLFDISDPENPTESATFVDVGAYSTIGYDFKSFRYLPLSKKLIFPRSKYSRDGSFDGFAVYDIGADAITKSYQIQHASSYDINYGCWYSARMPPRSFVFKSKLTTILSHSVISTDLDDGDELWRLNLDEGLNGTDCHSYF